MAAVVRWVGRAIGLDVHRDFCVVAICEDGTVRSAGRVPSTPEGLAMLAESLLPTDRVALEVTGSCWEVARILEPHVQRVVVVSPEDTGISSARAKTDKLDARTLASLLWKGELEAVWMPDDRCRILRRRLARREQLMRARTRAKNEIHACLQRRLQARPPCSDLFGVKGRVWLAGLELPVEERESVDAGIRQIEFLDAEIAAAERLIAQQALSWPEIRRLMTVPRREPGVRRDVHRRGRKRQPVPDQPQARGLPGAGSQGPPIRRGAGALRPDLQARVGVGSLGSGRSGVERGAAARPVARVL
jgi:transposase